MDRQGRVPAGRGGGEGWDDGVGVDADLIEHEAGGITRVGLQENFKLDVSAEVVTGVQDPNPLAPVQLGQPL